MIPARFCVIALALLFASAANCQQPVSGDIWKWIPFETQPNAKDAQIVRNAQYISIKIEAAHVSYKSGFLENIKKIAITSNVSLDLGAQKIQALNVNRTWEKTGNGSDDDIPENELLVVLSPASATSINVQIQFAGIGEDRFKAIFDILSNTDVKTALNLSPAVIAQSSLVTSIVQKFLATPYTSSTPRSVLGMHQGFVIYADSTSERVDSLRQGYIVVISGAEKKSADLNIVLSLPSDSLRFDTASHVLQTKQGNSWQTFTGNSYVVLSVTVDSVRGTDENSPWFAKFSQADRATENLLTGDVVDKVRKDAVALWQEGVTLLSADPNYVETERKQIRLKALADIEDDLKKHGASPSEASLAATVSETPETLAAVAKNYVAQVQQANVGGAVSIQVRDKAGKPIANAQAVVQSVNSGKIVTATTSETGNITVNSLNPGTYKVRVNQAGFATGETSDIIVQPRMTKQVLLQLPQGSK